jgi:RNA polymerase sigma factor (sigma-70 family)
MPAPSSLACNPLVYREAERAALRLVRRFRLPEADLDDLRQDLLVELLKRLHHFDPNRGTLGAFAATIIKHCASSFALRLRRDRTQIDPRSLDEPDKRPDGTTLGQILSEDRGYLAWISQAEDHVTRLERDLTLRRGVKALAPEQLQLLEQLSDHSVQSLSGNGVRSRATLYRQLREIRFCLLAAGLGLEA